MRVFEAFIFVIEHALLVNFRQAQHPSLLNPSRPAMGEQFGPLQKGRGGCFVAAPTP